MFRENQVAGSVAVERGLLLSIFDFKRKKYRTFLQDSETGEEIAEEYEKGRGVWKSMMFRMGRVRR